MAHVSLMVVEDEAIIALDIQSTLQRLGYTVVAVVATGEDAVQAAASTRPDLVLMDIRLAGALDGIAAATEIRHQLRIPVIYLTAHADEPTLQRAKVCEPYAYILKPFEERELHVAVEMTLYKHQMELKLQQVERWLATTLNSIGDAVIATDVDGNVTFMNPVAEALVGRLQSDVFGQSLSSVFQLVDTETHQPSTIPTGSNLQASLTVQLSNRMLLRNRDGSQYYINYSAAPIRDNDTITGGVVVFRDVTAWKGVEDALRRSEERYALAMEGANDGLWDWELATDTLYVSPRWRAMLGFDQLELITTSSEWFKRVHAEDYSQVQKAVDEHLAGHSPQLQVEQRMLHHDGTYRWMLARGLAVRDATNTATRMAGSLTDVTERKWAEAQLKHDALHDGLTQLPNRTLFLDRLAQAVARSRRHNEYRFAVLFMDLDRFKLVNDSLGHHVGDQLLMVTARRLESCLRSSDTLARFGGDEFAILLHDIADAGDAIVVTERIQQRLGGPLQLDSHDLHVGASIGIVFAAATYDEPDAMLRDADIALYRAKARGRNCFEIFDQAMHLHAVEVLRLETELRQALLQQQMVLHYQSVVCLKTGVITGVEALVRWMHPQRGLIVPHDFIPIAEDSGLIVPLGWWVLREACHQMQAWHNELMLDPPLTVSVNVSAKQFTQPDFAKQVQMILIETGLAATQLRVEITETVLMTHIERVMETLAQLKGMGVQLYLDDFGTGYSSLSYVHRLPIDALKIDRSFVMKLGLANRETVIVQTIVSLARQLGIQVIAEGIETEEQHTWVREIHCDHAQGYLFSHPLPAIDMTVLLVEQCPA